MSQPSYAINQPVALVGLEADASIASDVFTGVCPGASIPYGSLVVKDTAGSDQAMKLAASAGDITGGLRKGVVLRSHIGEQPYPIGSAAPAYLAKSALPVMRKGRVWVLCEDQITVGTSVPYARHAANGGNTNLGGFRGSADTGAAALDATKARFITSTTGANQLAQLEVDL